VNNKKISRCSLAAIVLAVSAGTALAQPVEQGGPPQIISHRTNPHTESGSPPAGSTGFITPLITYHGGPVMGTPTAYLIWYGNWNQGNGSDTPAGQAIVTDFLYGLNASPYYATNASYTGVSGNFSVGGAYTDNYSQGSNLSDRKVAAVVSNAINSGKLPKDGNGIYFVLTSSDVSESSGFCSRYCGWHTYGTLSGTNIKYSFVGNANRCLNACSAQTNSPNGNAGVDGMVSVIAHELEETNTDPNLNAWYDANGAEDADKCAWTFGQNLLQTGTGAFYNMTLATSSGGTRPFLIQRELDVNSLCYVNYVTKAQ
jgi:Phosphate-induced protein 1 conserved region